LNRAYSLLTIKSVDDEQRVITGMATTPATDRSGDIVEPGGAEFKLPIPLLWQHNSREPIGEVFAAKVTEAGIEIKARIAQTDVPGTLKDRLDEAWQSLKLGLVKGLSIGFKSLEDADIKGTFGIRFLKWLWLELSAVTIPANAEASILSLKSFDIGRAALGTGAAGECIQRSGVSDPRRVVQARTSPNMKKTITEQIATWVATRKEKTDQLDAIATKGAETGVTIDEADLEQHTELEAEVEAIDAQLRVLRAAEARNVAAAVVVKAATAEEAAKSRAPYSRVTVEKTLPPGIGFAQFAMCVMKAKGSMSDAMQFAKDFYPDSSQLHAALRVKAAVGAGAALTSHWADDLVPYNILMNDFIEYLRPGSIVGKFGGPNPGAPGTNYPALNRVPFNVRTSGFSAGTTGYWVQEGLPIPVSKATSFTATLTWAKVGGISILTQEEVRFSNPSAEAKVRDDIARAINARMDVDFVDPAKAAVANVSPASITDSVIATTPSGTAATNVRKDLATMLAAFAAANLDPSDLVLIMSASMAAQISMMVNTLGNDDFPGLSMNGGILRSIPVIVSEHLTAVGSPSTQTIVLVKAGDVYLADDGAVTIDASGEASVEMLDSALVQTGIVGTGASMVSLWQSGLLGLKAQREVTWKLRRSTAVQYLSPAAYVAA
jgi:HK97 family phage major capsid protein/HK97 family phage prohead protease